MNLLVNAQIIFVTAKPLYQRLIDLSGYDGSIQIPDNIQSESNVVSVFQKLAEDMYSSFKGVLKCGNLESKIILSPAPVVIIIVTLKIYFLDESISTSQAYTKTTDFSTQTFTVSDLIEVRGFIPIADVGSPMAVSRHLILPSSQSTKSNEVDMTEDNTSDDASTPSFCVLLHGALKVENMAALVTVGENWFGFIYSWADSKKKSNLMMTVLTPGSDVIPW